MDQSPLLSKSHSSPVPTRSPSPLTALAAPLGCCISGDVHFPLHLKSPLSSGFSTGPPFPSPPTSWKGSSPGQAPLSCLDIPSPLHPLETSILGLSWLSRAPKTAGHPPSTLPQVQNHSPTLTVFLLLTHFGSLAPGLNPPSGLCLWAQAYGCIFPYPTLLFPGPLQTPYSLTVPNIKKCTNTPLSVTHLHTSLNWFPNPIPPTRTSYLSLPFKLYRHLNPIPSLAWFGPIGPPSKAEEWPNSTRTKHYLSQAVLKTENEG